MPRGINNPNVTPCGHCRGRGYIRDPSFGIKITCSACGGRGWIPIRQPADRPPMTKKEIKNHERYEQTKRDYDRYMIMKFYRFFIERPFQLIYSLFGSKKYFISWKHYVSCIWWGMFTFSIYWYFSNPLPPEYIMVIMSFILIIILYYGIKSRVELK